MAAAAGSAAASTLTMRTPAVPRYLLPRLSARPSAVRNSSRSASTVFEASRGQHFRSGASAGAAHQWTPPRGTNTTLNSQTTRPETTGSEYQTTNQRLNSQTALQTKYETTKPRPNQKTIARPGSRPSSRVAVIGQRQFSSSGVQQRDHHFDTLRFVKRLQEDGFTEEQAQAVMRVLADVIEESIQNLTRTMVLREDALKSSYTQKVDFSALRTELLSLDNSETTLTRTTHERLAGELQKFNQRLHDEIARTQASVRLDLNLEKGRIREEANQQELKIKETATRIEQEVASLRERVEGVKFSTLQWLMGVCTGTAALILTAWRLLM